MSTNNLLTMNIVFKIKGKIKYLQIKKTDEMPRCEPQGTLNDSPQDEGIKMKT